MDELVGMNVRRLNTPEGAEQVPSRIGRMLREGGLEFEAMYVRKDGSRVDVEVRTRTIKSGGRTLLLSVGRDVTQRKADEAELRMRGELLDSVHDSVFLHDLMGKFLYVNEAAAATLGYTRGELLFLKVQQMSSPEHSVLFRRRIDVLLRKGSTTFESEHLRKDDSVLPVEVRASLVESGEKTLVLCVARDITGQKLAQQALKDSEEKYRTLFEQSMDAIYITASDGSAVEVNQAWLDLFGYSRDESSCLKAVDFYADPQEREDFLRRIAETGLVEDEVRLKKKDGTVMDCLRSGMARKDSQGNVVAYQGVIHDITNRKRAQQTLKDSEEKYRSLFEQSVDAGSLTTPAGAFVEVNQAWFDLYGYARDELPGLNAVDFYANPQEREDFLRRMAETGSVEEEVRLKRKDGTVVDCQRTVVARKDEHGDTVAYQSLTRDITERKLAQQTLKDSEEKYRALFEQSMDAIYICDPDGGNIRANHAWLDLFGYSRDELSGLNAVDTYANPQDREDFLRRIAGAGHVREEARFKKKDGTVMDCQRTVVARKDEHGNTVVYQGIYRDITEQKLAQQTLKDSEEKYRTLFEQSMDAVSVAAVDGTLLDANPAYLRLYGHDVADIGRANVRDHYLRAPDRDKFLRWMEQHNVIQDEGVRLKKVDGTVMDCLRTSIAIRDETGRIVSFQTVVRDVTGQKNAEDVLRASEARFRELSELLPQAVCETDVRGNIMFVNRRALDLWGYGEEDAETGLNFCELIAPEDLDRARADFESPQTWEGDVAGEFMALRKDGTVFPVQVYRSPIARGGEVVGVRIVLIDISDRKKTEQQLHDLAAHIEEVREDERTGIARELHDQLAQALTAMKLDLADMKGRLEKGEAIPPGKLAGTMSLIDETAADVRRISSELRPGLLDDLGLVAAMEWQLSQFGERSGLKCRLDSRTDDSDLGRSRSTALFRIFQELLTNIGRHAGASGVHVSFELDDGRYVLTVADDGRGITEEEMTTPGSLGLIGMRERVRPFGGRIEIEGVPKAGTTVRVYVPAG